MSILFRPHRQGSLSPFVFYQSTELFARQIWMLFTSKQTKTDHIIRIMPADLTINNDMNHGFGMDM